MNKEEMELEKLALELKSLKHPWYLKPSNFISVLSLLFAVYQFQLAERKTYLADAKEVKADQLIVENTKTADFLSARETKVSTVQKELILSKGSAVKATDRIMDVWAYGVKESVVQSVREHLISKGNEVGFGGLLDYLPSWLARESTVFYYDKNTKSIARALADDLEKVTGISFKTRWGAGLGVNEDEKDKTFFIHLVSN